MFRSVTLNTHSVVPPSPPAPPGCFSFPQTGSRSPVNTDSPTAPCSPLNVVTLGTSYDTEFVCQCLVYFTWRNVFQVRLLCGMCQNCLPFIRLNNSLLYEGTIFCLSIHPLVDTRVASTPWLGNKAAVNMGVQYLFETLPPVLSDAHPEVELLHHM